MGKRRHSTLTDTLVVRTTPMDDGSFSTAWQFRFPGPRRPRAGVVVTRLDAAYEHDRPVIAELAAIQHLLDRKVITGDAKRLGASLKILVSFQAIADAVDKTQLKTSGRGKAVGQDIARCALFLATKYFEAEVRASETVEDRIPKSLELDEIVVQQPFPGATIYCQVLQEDVLITRHALRQRLARLHRARPPLPDTEDDLSHLGARRWSRAWKWFETVLGSRPQLHPVRLLRRWRSRFARTYGTRSQYLWHPASKGIIVVSRDSSGRLVAATVLREEFGHIG